MLTPNFATIFAGVLALGTHASTALASCNADNCYRALFPCPSPSAVSSAAAFCATITAGGTTATDFPTRAISACGTAASRYISACGCGPTCPGLPTPTAKPCPPSGGLLTNGDFECGLSPWNIEFLDPEVCISITSISSNSGRRSFEAKLLENRPRQEPVLSVIVGSGVFSVQRNVPGRLNFALWFDNMNAGFVGVRVNGAPVRTVDARDGAGWGVWKAVSIDYTPNSDSLQVTFEFLYGRVASVVRLDSVVFNHLR